MVGFVITRLVRATAPFLFKAKLARDCTGSLGPKWLHGPPHNPGFEQLAAANPPVQHMEEWQFRWISALRPQLILLAALLVVVFGAGGALGEYPERPVRCLIPQSPGGASDTVGRIVAQKLADQFGQQFVVDNRPGATGNIGHEIVARAVRDAEKLGKDLAELPIETLRGYSALVREDVYTVLSPEGSVASRDHIGGTAPRQVRMAVGRARERLGS